jgi:hypothetical protein
MIFPTYHMATAEDVFNKSEDYSFIKGEGNLCRTYGTKDKRHLAKQVFHNFMKRVSDDVIEEGVAFNFPKYNASLYVEEIDPEVVKKLKGRGHMSQFSDIFAEGKAYGIVYRYKQNATYIKKTAIVGKDLYQLMVDLVNKGKRYFGITRSW